MRKTIVNEKFRIWVYGIGIAAGSVAVVYGFMTAEEVAVWLGLLSAILGLTAVAHVGEKGVDNVA